MWFRRFRPKDVKIVHGDKTVTRCVALVRDPNPPFGRGVCWMAIFPPVKLNPESDICVIRWLPAHTAVKICLAIEVHGPDHR